LSGPFSPLRRPHLFFFFQTPEVRPFPTPFLACFLCAKFCMPPVSPVFFVNFPPRFVFKSVLPPPFPAGPFRFFPPTPTTLDRSLLLFLGYLPCVCGFFPARRFLFLAVTCHPVHFFSLVFLFFISFPTPFNGLATMVFLCGDPYLAHDGPNFFC